MLFLKGFYVFYLYFFENEQLVNLIKINTLTMFLIIKIKLLMMVLRLRNTIGCEFGVKNVGKLAVGR